MKPNLIEILTRQHLSDAGNRPGEAKKCPVCAETDLTTTNLQGVVIDTCPKCHGACLDSRELNQLLEHSTGGTKPRATGWRTTLEVS